MSAPNAVKYEFKHDTHNRAVFLLVVFSLIGVVVSMLGLYWVFTDIRDDEMFRKVLMRENAELTALRAYEADLLTKYNITGQGADAQYRIPVDRAKALVVEEYSAK